MRINHNNFLQGMNQTADQIQRSYQAEQALKQVRTESEIEVKMRRLRELLEANGKKVPTAVDPTKNQRNPSQQESAGNENPGSENPDANPPASAEEGGPKPSGPTRIDIRV